jgi:hypothetical protein
MEVGAKGERAGALLLGLLCSPCYSLPYSSLSFSGDGPLGHPKVFINLDKPGAKACPYW